MINFTLRTCEIRFKSLNIHCCCCKKGVLQSCSLHWDDQHVLGSVGGCAWGKYQIGSPPQTDFFQPFLSLGARAGGTPVAGFSQGQLCIRDGVGILFPKWGVLPSHSLWARSALLCLAQGWGSAGAIEFSGKVAFACALVFYQEKSLFCTLQAAFTTLRSVIRKGLPGLLCLYLEEAMISICEVSSLVLWRRKGAGGATWGSQALQMQFELW